MKPRSPLLPIFLIVLVDILGMTIILPLLPFYAEHYGASPLVVGLLVATYAACSLISSPVIGNLSDRYGRRPLLLISQTGTLIGFLVMASADSLWLVFAARILDGLTAGNLSLAQAYVSDVTRPKDRAKAFGLIGIAFGIGFLIGPAITAWMSRYGYHYPVLAAAALSATSIVATWFLLPEVPRGGLSPAAGEADDGPAAPAGRRLGVLEWRGYLEFFRRPVLSRLLVQFFLFAFAFSCFTGGFGMFAERRFTWHGEPFDAREVGYVFAYVGFLGIILQGGLLGRMVKAVGEGWLITAGFLSAAVGYAALGYTYSIPMLLVVAAVSSFGSGVLRPALTSRITQEVGRHEQGVALGLSQSLSSIAMVIAPILAGLLIRAHWLLAWALLAAAASALGFILAAGTKPGTGSSS